MHKPFEYINSVSFTKEYLMDTKYDEKGYNSFLTNRNFSYFTDTLMYAQSMNMCCGIDSKLQYDFYFHSLRKRKRFTKWYKNTPDDELDSIMKVYSCNRTRAQEYKKILTHDQLHELIAKTTNT